MGALNATNEVIERDPGPAEPAGAGGPRIALLCCDDARHLYLAHELERRFGLAGVVLERNRAQRRRLWLRRRWRDWLYRAYHSWRSRLSGESRQHHQFFHSLLPSGAGWPRGTLEVDWINAPEAHQALERWRPHVTVICGTGIVRASLLAHAGAAINIHGGCLPEYKGNHCVFFAFYEKRYDQIGATLHRVIPKLDSGPILAVVRPPVYPHDDDAALYCRSVHLAMEKLFELLAGLEPGDELPSLEQPAGGRVFRHRDRKPLLDLALWGRRCLGRHRVPCIPSARIDVPK